MPARWVLYLSRVILRFVFKVALPMALTNALAVSCILAIERGCLPARAGTFTIDPRATYTIVGVQSGRCVSVARASPRSQASLEIATCNGATYQQFRAQPMGNGFFRLQNVSSSLCVDVSGASTASGAKVIQYACGSDKNQQWSFTDVANGIERITSRNSGLVLDVTGQGTADGAPLEQWTSNDGANQEFTLEVVAKNNGSGTSGATPPLGAGPPPAPSTR